MSSMYSEFIKRINIGDKLLCKFSNYTISSITRYGGYNGIFTEGEYYVVDYVGNGIVNIVSNSGALFNMYNVVYDIFDVNDYYYDGEYDEEYEDI